MLNDREVEDDIAFFFRDPFDYNEIDEKFSPLYLVRRDIIEITGETKINDVLINERLIFPFTILVFIGIDILSLCYSGRNIDKKKDREIAVSRDMFMNFIKEYLDDNVDCHALWLTRNSLVHTFGGGVAKTHSNGGYSFVYSRNNSKLLTQTKDSDNLIIINLDTTLLYSKFKTAIARYVHDLQSSIDLKNKFEDVLDKYGHIYLYR